MAESDTGEPASHSTLWSALSILRNGQTDGDSPSPSGLIPVVPEHQSQVQVTSTSSVPTVSSSVFGLSQSMDIMNSATDFSVGFSPPPGIVPQSSSGTNAQQERSTPQQQHQSDMNVPTLTEVSPPLEVGVQREDDGEEGMDSSNKFAEEDRREEEVNHPPQNTAEEEVNQFSIEELMETSRQNIVPTEEVRLAEEKRRQELMLQQRKLFRTICVPGELSTASDNVSSDGEGFIEPSNYRMRRKVHEGDVDQVTPPASHLSRFPSTSRDAALSMTDTTESEAEVVPDPSQTKEDKRPRKVPQQKRPLNNKEDQESRWILDYQSVTLNRQEQATVDSDAIQVSRDTTPPLSSPSRHDTVVDAPLPSSSPQVQGSSSYPSSSSSHSDTTELPPSTSQSSGNRISDGSSITTTTSTSGSSLEVSGVCASSQGTDVQSLSSQTSAQPLFSSTPNETNETGLDTTMIITTTDTVPPLMPPPNLPPVKRSSTDASTSSSGTSGYLYKNKGVVRLTGGDDETTTTGIPTSESTESLSLTPLAPATPTNDRSMEVTNDVIPATPLSGTMEETTHGTVELPPSQDDLFQDTHPDSQFEVDNQLPKWMAHLPQRLQGQQTPVKESTTSSSDDYTGSSPVEEAMTSKRPRLDSSSDSSTLSSSSSPVKPVSKRQRVSSTPFTPDFNEPPKWMKQQMKSAVYHSTPSSSNTAPPAETESSLTLSSAGSSPNKSSQSPMNSVTSSSIGSSGRSLSSGYLASSSSIGSSGFTPPGSIVREPSSLASTSLTQSGLVNKMVASVDTVDKKSEVKVTSGDASSDNANNNNGSSQSTVESGSRDGGKGGCESSTEDGDSESRGDGGGRVAVVSSSHSPEYGGTTGHDADVSAMTGETSSNNNTPPLPLVTSAGKENEEDCSSKDPVSKESDEVHVNTGETQGEVIKSDKPEMVNETDSDTCTYMSDAIHDGAEHAARDPLTVETLDEMEVDEAGNGVAVLTDQKDIEVDSSQMSFTLRLSPSQSQSLFKRPVPPKSLPDGGTEELNMPQHESQIPQDIIDLTSSLSDTAMCSLSQETETASQTDPTPFPPPPCLAQETETADQIDPAPSPPPPPQGTINLTSPHVHVLSSLCTWSQQQDQGQTNVVSSTASRLPGQVAGHSSQSQVHVTIEPTVPPYEEMFTLTTPPSCAALQRTSAKSMYESIQYSSVDELHNTPPLPEQDTPLIPEHQPVSVSGGGKDVNQVNTAESPDTNQYSSSGTPFQFNLPAGNSVLRPISRITPPSQLPSLSSSSSAVMTDTGTALAKPENVNQTHTYQAAIPEGHIDEQSGTKAGPLPLPAPHQDEVSSSSSSECLLPYNKLPRLEMEKQTDTDTTKINEEEPVAADWDSNELDTKESNSTEPEVEDRFQSKVVSGESSSTHPAGNDDVAAETEPRDKAKGRPDKEQPKLPITIAPFVLGDLGEGEEGENLDDSQVYVMPEITGMEDSEQDSVSTCNFYLRRPQKVPVPVSSALGQQHSTHGVGTEMRLEDETQSQDNSEDPFEFNSEKRLVMPIRRRKKPTSVSVTNTVRMNPVLPVAGSSGVLPEVTNNNSFTVPVSSTDSNRGNPVTISRTCVPTRTVGFAQAVPQGSKSNTPQTPTLSTSLVVTTPTSYLPDNLIPMHYSTPSHCLPTGSIPRISNPLNQSTCSSDLSFGASSQYTPVSFSSPSGFVQPHAIESLCSSSQYVRLHHIRTVTTVRQFVSTEIIDRSTGNIIHSGFSEVPVEHPQEHQQVSLRAEPLSALPPGVMCSPSPSSTSLTTPPLSTFNNTSVMHCPSSVPMTGVQYVPTGSIHFTPQLVNPPCSTGLITPETPPTPASQPLRTSLTQFSSPQPSLPTTSETLPYDVMRRRSNTMLSSYDLKPGMKVVARWRDKKWYAATVRKKTTKKVSLAFMDGDNDSVAVQHVLPLSLLPTGTSVVALEAEDEDDKDSSALEQSGSFLEFGTKTFKLETDSAGVVNCDLKRLMLTEESGEMAMTVASSSVGETSAVKFFYGYVFMLTDQKKEATGVSSGGSEGNPVKREAIEEMIKSRGGFIMEEYKSTKVLEKKTICLSNTYCRTVKYLIALAINIPCVSHEWVKECLKQNKFVSYQSFILPAGVSTLSKQLVKWNPRPKRFFQSTVYIHGDKAFKDFWEKVCSAGGAKILLKLPSKTRVAGQVTVVIDSNRSTIPQSIRDLRGIVQLVTSDWLVECFLQGATTHNKDFLI